MSKINSLLPHKIIGVAVIWNEQEQILIDRRRPEGAMGGLWEFPGGKIEPGETISECIQREISEELGIVIEVGEHLITIDHTYTDLRVTLTVHHCRHVTGVPQPLESDEIRWVTLEELEEFTFPKANIQIIAALKGMGSREWGVGGDEGDEGAGEEGEEELLMINAQCPMPHAQ